MRYFIHLSFDGSNYSGWQRQKETAKTVQEVVEQSLTSILKNETLLVGCGRTDAGVHASQYVAHFDTDDAFSFDLVYRLNKNLPNDIVIYEILEVGPKHHARFDANSRSYNYFMHWKKDPFISNFSAYYDEPKLDFESMRKATKLLTQVNDFKALCKQPELHENTICIISHCQLFVNEEQGRLRLLMTSNRFLRGMIRHTIFYLLEIGKGKLTLKEFQKILNLESTPGQKQPAHPNGLFLSSLKYPQLKLKPTFNIVESLKTGL